MYFAFLLVLFMYATSCKCSFFKKSENISTHFCKRGHIRKHRTIRKESFLRYSFGNIRKNQWGITKHIKRKNRKCFGKEDRWSFLSSIESPIVGIKIQELLKSYKCKEKIGKKEMNFVHFYLDKIYFKIREDYLYKDRKKLNLMLCLYYIPMVTSQLLKTLLNRFHIYDGYIKEHFLYHLILKYFFVNYKNYKEEILDIVGKKRYMFIRSHGKELKKYILKKRKQLDSYNNKILDIYCKMKKKENIIQDCLNQKKKNIKRFFTKLQRNIKYYNICDRFVIVHYLYQHCQYRLILLFFKKFIYESLNKNNSFIIHFVNLLNDNTLWSKNTIFAPQSYFFFKRTTAYNTQNEKANSKKLEKSTEESVYIQNDANEFIEKCITNLMYVKNWTNLNGDDNVVRNGNSYRFLLYVYLLNTFLEKRNTYYIGMFLHQFLSYYSNYSVLEDDNKSFYFVLTVDYFMKQFYLKRKYDITEQDESELSEQMPPFFHYIKIYNEDMFSTSKRYNLRYLTNVSTFALYYIQKLLVSPSSSYGFSYLFMPLPDSVFEDKLYLLKYFSCLMFLQQVCLLEINLNKDFINKHVEKCSTKEMRQIPNSIGTEQMFEIINDTYEYALKYLWEPFSVYQVFFDEVYFFFKHYTDDILYGSLKKKKTLIHFLKKRKWLFSLSAIHTYFLLLILSTLNVLEKNKYIEHIIKANKKYLELIPNEIINNILENNKRENNRKNDYILDSLLIEYRSMYLLYKQMLTSKDPDKIKNMLFYSVNCIIDNKKKKKDLFCLKRKIFALNIKQLFFLFTHLYDLRLHKDLVRTFDYMMEDEHFKRIFNYASIKGKKKRNDIGGDESDKETYARCARNIYLLYFLSHFRLQHFLSFSKNKYMNKELFNVCFNQDPFSVFYFYMEKYGKPEKYNNIENLEEFEKKKKFLSDTGKQMPQYVLYTLLENAKTNKIVNDIITFFFINNLYASLNDEEYTFLFYALMKYLYKTKVTEEYEKLDEETSTAKKTSKDNMSTYKLVYSLFCCSYFFYKTICDEISVVNFLIVTKTCLIARDMKMFQMFCKQNKKLIENNFLLFNSLFNRYFDHSYVKQMGKWELFSYESFLNVPVHMYIVHKNKVIIYDLNNNKIVNVIDIGHYERKIKIFFFIDIRKICICLATLNSFFNFHFLKNRAFQQFLTDNSIPLDLDANNVYDVSEFIIFWGNSVDKREKIKKYILSNYDNFVIRKHKIIKDAFLFSLKK